MPKRGAVALLLTTIALAVLLSFKTPAEVPVATGGAAIVGTASPAPGVASPTPGVVSPTPAAAAPPAATAGPAAVERSTASPAPSTSASPAPTAYRDGTVNGSAVQTRFGPVQVQVTISNGAISDVTALQLPSGDRHSYEISQRAEPILRSAVLEAQSAEITILSGATYTSLAYAQSLQAALDAARA